jgi:hypothetical protein
MLQWEAAAAAAVPFIYSQQRRIDAKKHFHWHHAVHISTLDYK